MPKTLLLLVAIFFTVCTTAQNQGLKGIVKDISNSEPLPSAHVYIPSLGQGIVSDDNGQFEFPLPNGNYEVIVQFIGYADYVIEVEVNGNWVELEIEMQASSIGLGSVVVTAGKFEQRLEDVTVSIEILKPELIENKNSRYVDEAINQSPGVAIIDDQASIRGGSGWSMGAGTRVTTMVDGIPLVSGDAGQVQWEMVPLENIEQMEIIKGASSALYGSSAMNGVINFRTSYPGSEPSTKASLYQGIYGTPKRTESKWWNGSQGYTGFTLLHKQSKGFLDLVGGLFLLRDEGFQYGVHDHRARLNIGLRYRPENIPGLAFGLNGNIMTKDMGDFLLWNGEDQGYIPLDTNVTTATGTTFYIDPYITYYIGRHRHELKSRYFEINNYPRSSTNNYDNFSKMLYLEYQYQNQLNENSTLTMGSMYNGVNSDGTVFNGAHSSTNLSGYAQLDQKIDNLNFSIGVRYEYFELDGDVNHRPVIRSGINYKLGKATFFRSSFGQGYRYPSISEKFTLTNVGAIFVYPNLQLQPESGYSAELGVKQGLKLGKWNGFIDLAAFIMRYDDMMEFTFGLWPTGYPNGPSTGIGFTSVNIGPAVMRGTELTLIGEGEIAGINVRIIGGYTFMDPKILYPDSVYSSVQVSDNVVVELDYKTTSSDTSGILKYRYRHLAKLDLQLEKNKWSGGFSIRYNSFMQNIDAYLESLYGIGDVRDRLNKGDLIVDARIQYQVHQHFRLGFIVDNLFNREYMPRPAMYGQPVTYSLQLNMDI